MSTSTKEMEQSKMTTGKLKDMAEDLKHEMMFSDQCAHDALCDLMERYNSFSALSEAECGELIEEVEK